MAVRIKSVRGNSPYFRPGDEILSIDSRPVYDQLDILFLTHDQGAIRFEIRRKAGGIIPLDVSLDVFEEAGLSFEEMRFTRCGSRCIFCFIDQMPQGLRETLYEKDDDYRLSFIFGNYITLNDVSDEEIDRIIEYNLSPLYISVHAVDHKIRERLFGRPIKRNILELLKRLGKGGITMHLQIVLVPGINDGESLDSTVDALFELYPACRSVAVVPVGLTKHRKGLENLRKVTEQESRSLINWAERKRSIFVSATGNEHFLHVSDEFYITVRRKIPDSDSYDNFPQISNGVGLCRQFIDDIKRDLERLKSRKPTGIDMAVVTGTMGGRFLRRHIKPIIESEFSNAAIDIIAVNNSLFGSSVTVSGLLSGNDIIRSVESSGTSARCIVIPPNAVNNAGLLIDDLSLEDLAKRLGRPVFVPERTFLEPAIVEPCREEATR